MRISILALVLVIVMLSVSVTQAQSRPTQNVLADIPCQNVLAETPCPCRCSCIYTGVCDCGANCLCPDCPAYIYTQGNQPYSVGLKSQHNGWNWTWDGKQWQPNGPIARTAFFAPKINYAVFAGNCAGGG